VGITVYAAGTSPNLPEYTFNYNPPVRLVFDQSVWTYYKILTDGSLEAQNGVTGVLKIIDKSEALMRWAVKTALARTKKLLMEGGYVGEDAKKLFETTLNSILSQAKKADREDLEAAGEIGHEAHAWIESVIKSVLAGDEDRRLELFAKLPVDERAANACIAAIVWMSEHNVRWISTERKVFSLQHGYAGTMDGLATVDSCSDRTCCPVDFCNRLSLVDWKTSNFLYVTYLMQAACYQHAHQEETGEKIEDRWIIRLGKDDAEFEPWHIEGEKDFYEDFHGFLCALALYKSVHNIDDRVAAFKAKRTAARRAFAKELRDIGYAIKCLDVDEYKGVRKKKGCNGTEKMCQKCEEIYAERHKDNTPVQNP
jgi:hypothetical protein